MALTPEAKWLILLSATSSCRSTELCYTGYFSARTYVKSHVRSDSTLGPLELILLLCTSFSFARGVSGAQRVVFDFSASG